MFVVRTDQNPVPVPATGFRRLDEQQHQTLEDVRGKATEHSPGEEGPVASKRLENPLVLGDDGLYFDPAFLRSSASRVNTTLLSMVTRLMFSSVHAASYIGPSTRGQGTSPVHGFVQVVGSSTVNW